MENQDHYKEHFCFLGIGSCGSSTKSTKEGRQIADNFISSLLDSSNTCDQSQVQQIVQNIQSDGYIIMSGQQIDMVSLQNISCLSSQNLSEVMEGDFKQKLTSDVSSKTSGISLASSQSADTVITEVVNKLTSLSNIKLLQQQAQSLSQGVIQNLKAKKSIIIINQDIDTAAEQIINGQALQVDSVLNKYRMDTDTQTQTSSMADGLFSGSTIQSIFYMFFICIVIIAVLFIIKALIKSRNGANSSQEIQKLQLQIKLKELEKKL